MLGGRKPWPARSLLRCHARSAADGLSYPALMTTDALDAPLLEQTDASLSRPLHPALIGARTDVIAAAADLMEIPEAALTRPWTWMRPSGYVRPPASRST